MFFAYASKLNLQPNEQFKNLETGCLLFHFPNLKSHGCFIFSLSFSGGDTETARGETVREETVRKGQKTTNYWKIFLLKHILRSEEKCLSKLSIKIFIKRKT